MTAAWIAIVIVLAVVSQAGAGASLVVQRTVTVRTPEGSKVRLRLTPTGVRWVSWDNFDLSWTLASFWWLRYLRTQRRTWQVLAIEWDRSRKPFVTGEYASRRDAEHGLDELAGQIASGELTPRRGQQ